MGDEREGLTVEQLEAFGYPRPIVENVRLLIERAETAERERDEVFQEVQDNAKAAAKWMGQFLRPEQELAKYTGLEAMGDEREGLSSLLDQVNAPIVGSVDERAVQLYDVDEARRKIVSAVPGLLARVGQLTQELQEAGAIVVAADEMFGWMQKHYPKALDALPTPIYQRLRIASLALSTSTEETP